MASPPRPRLRRRAGCWAGRCVCLTVCVGLRREELRSVGVLPAEEARKRRRIRLAREPQAAASEASLEKWSRLADLQSAGGGWRLMKKGRRGTACQQLAPMLKSCIRLMSVPSPSSMPCSSNASGSYPGATCATVASSLAAAAARFAWWGSMRNLKLPSQPRLRRFLGFPRRKGGRR